MEEVNIVVLILSKLRWRPLPKALCATSEEKDQQ